jgi:hypothetical protein
MAEAWLGHWSSKQPDTSNAKGSSELKPRLESEPRVCQAITEAMMIETRCVEERLELRAQAALQHCRRRGCQDACITAFTGHACHRTSQLGGRVWTHLHDSHM